MGSRHASWRPQNTIIQGGIMKQMTPEKAVQIIDDVITREVEWADDPTDEIQEAWDKIQILVAKGKIAKKYIKQWSKS